MWKEQRQPREEAIVSGYARPSSPLFDVIGRLLDRSQHSENPRPSVSLGPGEVRPDPSELAQKQLTPARP